MRLYRWLLRLSPEALRREYGPAMEEMFARRLSAARDAGIGRRADVWWRELAGLLVLAASERFGSAARMRRQHQRRIAGPKAGIMDTIAQELRHAARRLMPMSIAGGPHIPAQALIGPNITTMTYVVRSRTDPADLAGPARAAVENVDPNLALAQVRTQQEIVDRASDQMSFTMVLLGIAASVALLLGAIGIYGVVSYIAAQRTGEIGLRLALGAEPSGVAAMILRQSAGVTMIGMVWAWSPRWRAGG